MLFVELLKVKAGTPEDRIARRVEWQYPEGIRPIAEYWLPTEDPAAIVIFETDNEDLIFQASVQWGDLFDIKVIPAITYERGLQFAKQMMQG